MKRSGVLHGDLSRLIASLGHGDLLVIGDAGLPVPPGVPVIDLALSPGIPGVFDVLDAVLSELVVEHAVLAQEAAPDLSARFVQRPIGAARAVPHEDFKRLCHHARAVIRSGEFTPYANIGLYAGVAF